MFYPVQQEAILQEIVLHLTAGGKFNEALEELESYVSPMFLRYAFRTFCV